MQGAQSTADSSSMGANHACGRVGHNARPQAAGQAGGHTPKHASARPATGTAAGGALP